MNKQNYTLTLEPAPTTLTAGDNRPAANDTPDGLWTSDDCAAYFKISRWTFVNRLSKKPGFPKPHVEMSRRMRRWLPEDIKDYQTRRGR
ncbi:hypothetical protein [Dyella sp. ASV21]|uniref:helix-turn-helix transcriptional regulator n=1 Tax=Dyella sp. ASV21 TaxID=2795114 RepID=UPI0018EBB60A|nr:hypothetical protein [Dyella sp. ASV21]